MERKYSDIVLCDRDQIICLKCNQRTLLSFIRIPDQDENIITVFGRFCKRCKCFYVTVDKSNREAINYRKDKTKLPFISMPDFKNKLGKELVSSEEITTEKPCPITKSETVTDQSQEKSTVKPCSEKTVSEKHVKQENVISSNLIDSRPASAEVILQLEINGRMEEIIVVSEATEADNNTVYYYESEEGRELLTAAYRRERAKKGLLRNEEFTVVSREECRKNTLLMPSEINIRTGGGYKHYIKNPHYEKIVHLLLYSPFSKRYEVIRGTMYVLTHKVFIDMGLYKRFCEEHGNPGVWYPMGRYSSSDTWDNLQTESVLKMFGYTVAENDDLGPRARRRLLQDIIDLGIITKRRTISFLDFFILSHPHNYNAQQKWKSDRNWLMDYQENPERFLIAKN